MLKPTGAHQRFGATEETVIHSGVTYSLKYLTENFSPVIR